MQYSPGEINMSSEPENTSKQPIDALHLDHGLKLARSVWIRWLCIILAWLCLITAVLGLFIPGLPTVDFIMLAIFFAARGSRRLYFALVNNRYIGPVLLEWHLHRRLPKRVKYISTVSMSIAALLMIYHIPHPWVLYPLLGCLLCALLIVWRK